jgi:two-component sensor histidine kinase
MGPPVTPPKRRGFGSTVTTNLVEMSLEGTVDLQYRRAGVAWRLTCNAAKALEFGAGPTQFATPYKPRSVS